MEKYKEVIRKRIVTYGFSLIATGMMMMVLGNLLPIETTQHDLGFASGVTMGMLTGGCLVLLFNIGKMFAALKDDKTLRKMYIEETDERKVAIYQKIGGDYAQIQGTVQLVLSVCLVFLGYSEAGFILFGITCVEFIARLIMKVYYHQVL